MTDDRLFEVLCRHDPELQRLKRKHHVLVFMAIGWLTTTPFTIGVAVLLWAGLL